MNQALHILQVAVVFLLMITVLVAAHEMGHYLFARLFRMGIHEFAIGFGRPKLWTWRRTKETLEDGSELTTEFNLRAWPLGGFVRILGMEPSDDGSERRIPNGFYSRPAWQRFLVLLAGPVFSVAAGLLVLGPLTYVQGGTRETNRILDLRVDSAAYSAGLQRGDLITAVDGQTVSNGFQARALVRDRLTGSVRIGIVRDGRPLTIVTNPRVTEEPEPVLDENRFPVGEPRIQAKLGVVFDDRRIPIGLGDAFGQAIGATVESGKGLGRVFSRPKEAGNNVGGVITMVGATNSVVAEGFGSTLQLAALLSISIGIFNILPVPPLDGGQMAIALVEMLRGGRRLSLRIQNAFFTVGFALIITLFVGVFVLDLKKLRDRPEAAPKMLSGMDKTPAANR